MNAHPKFTESYFPKYETGPLIESTLGDLMLRNAEVVPDRLALIEGAADPSQRRRWSYRQLVDEVLACARGLLKHFKPGDRVGLLAPETPEWVIFQHGMSFAGLIIVPINPAYTAREVAFILGNAKAAGVVYADESRGKNLAAVVQEMQAQLDHLHTAVNVADLAALQAAGDPATPLPEQDPGQVMQIQYTSGTTGFPKGACLHHRGVINAAHFIVERAAFPIGGVWLNSMPMFHIGGAVVSEIGVFSRQGTFVLMRSFDPGLFLELIEAEKVNCSLIVPTMILALLNHPDAKTRDLTSFNSILSGAAAVPEALVKRAKAELNVEFAIMYGQTESNGPFLETFTTDSDELQSQTIGRPIPHVEVKVVDVVTMQTAPVNTVGEYWVRGFNTMTGYYGQPEASRAALTEDGWLRTGDLGTMDENGYFRITGRLKEMIIRGGMNLYPSEIESILFEHADVAQVAVIGVADDTWGETVAAVILPKNPEAPPSPDVLWSYCRKNLSPQKTPEHWIFVNEYPMTATGKIQKNVLRDWCAEGKLQPVTWRRPDRDSKVA
ncbi:class I adenylate-forming enzyme family protein [Mesorhizobium sp. L-8-3]|uniref:class I adenylate-forming enzyme family protein n=1 Tax=Mesorhizobium sp. L-8-3 TaxID=2744522 RepID=UPI0019281FF8|nr:AMP-binding protein [Mesorhizobium sp. L-8-3]BCH23482.1 AMP-binding protein [Mesorhizobium sp. L-8-3]